MMKRFLILLLAAALLLSAAGCGGAERGGGLRVVTTIFPIYDWVRVVTEGAAEDTELTWLMDSGVDLHSYQATAEDLAAIAECDLFIYVGGESDAWVDDALALSANPDRRVLDLMDVLGPALRREELTEGMEGDAEEDEYDEHVWLSLDNAGVLTTAIAEALCGLDPDRSAVYEANAAAYLDALEALKADYAAAVRDGTTDTLVFGDRFPFRYMTDELGLSYYAAFAGCSAETEASFETVLFLAQKVDELGLPAVLTLEGSDGRIARTVAESCGSAPAVLTLDSMQSVTAQDAADGATYLSIMEANLAALRQALAVE